MFFLRCLYFLCKHKGRNSQCVLSRSPRDLGPISRASAARAPRASRRLRRRACRTSSRTPRRSSRDSSRRRADDATRRVRAETRPETRPETRGSRPSRATFVQNEPKRTRDSRPRGRNPRAGRVARGRGTRPPPMGARKRARGAPRRATRRGGCLLARGMYALTRAVLEPRMKTFLSRRMKTVRSLLSPHPETTVVFTPPPLRAWRGGP